MKSIAFQCFLHTLILGVHDGLVFFFFWTSASLPSICSLCLTIRSLLFTSFCTVSLETLFKPMVKLSLWDALKTAEDSLTFLSVKTRA